MAFDTVRFAEDLALVIQRAKVMIRQHEKTCGFYLGAARGTCEELENLRSVLRNAQALGTTWGFVADSFD